MNDVLEMFTDQQRRLFIEIIQARNSELLKTLLQQHEPTQNQRHEVIKLLADEFSLNLDETSEPTTRGKEIDMLLEDFYPLGLLSSHGYP